MCNGLSIAGGQVGPGQRKELRYTAAWQTFGRQQHKVIVKDTDSGYEKALFVSMNVRQPRSVGSQPRYTTVVGADPGSTSCRCLAVEIGCARPMSFGPDLSAI
jgi:hypothetical protein